MRHSTPHSKAAECEDPGAPRGPVFINYDPHPDIWTQQSLAAQGCIRVFESGSGAFQYVYCPDEPTNEDIRLAVEADRQFRETSSSNGGPLAPTAATGVATAVDAGDTPPTFPGNPTFPGR